MGVFADVGPLPVFVSNHVRSDYYARLSRLTVTADPWRHQIWRECHSPSVHGQRGSGDWKRNASKDQDHRFEEWRWQHVCNRQHQGGFSRVCWTSPIHLTTCWQTCSTLWMVSCVFQYIGCIVVSRDLQRASDKSIVPLIKVLFFNEDWSKDRGGNFLKPSVTCDVRGAQDDHRRNMLDNPSWRSLDQMWNRCL